MSVDYSPEAITQRLRVMSAQTDLRTQRRLECKVNYTPEAITQRLKQQAMLRSACLKFAGLGSAPLHGTSAPPCASSPA